MDGKSGLFITILLYQSIDESVHALDKNIVV